MDEERSSLTIADLATRAGVTARTIRYYVAEGLLPPPEGHGQHRLYSSHHLRLLGAIKHLKEAYLPLVEIRRRLAHLSDADLERLTATGHEPLPTDGTPTIPSHLSMRGSTPEFVPGHGGGRVPSNPIARLYAGSNLAPEWSPAAYQGGPSSRTISEPTSERAPSEASTIWHRVILAPGVEIHFQPSGDRRRDEAIAHVIRAATSLLSSVARATGPAAE